MTKVAACLVALIIAFVITPRAGAIARHEAGKLQLPAYPTLQTPVEQIYKQMFIEQGIEPDSRKATIVRAWVEKIRHDPVILSVIPGGAQGVSQVFLDPRIRESVMSSGLARLSAADRLSYIQLLTRFLDELVPVNCYGEVDMGAAMNRVTLREMSDADVQQYFELLYKILSGDARKSPIVLPTPQQYAFAQLRLSRALLIELDGNESDVERYEAFARNPSLATPLDACWATRVTLHAIVAMPDPERDFILLRTLLPGDRQTEIPAGEATAP
jgi:hypothetical protein